MNTIHEATILNNCPPLAPLPTQTKPKLKNLNGVKAVLFDIYGTLLVSGSGDVGTAAATNNAKALTQALIASGFGGDLGLAGQEGIKRLKTEILYEHKIAREAGVDFPEIEISEIWKKVLSSLFNIPTDPDQIQCLALEYECRVNPVFPMPGCLEVLDKLQKRGLALGIVSNAQFYTPLLFSAFFKQTITELGFNPDCCVWSYKELKAKPSADLFPKAGRFLKQNYGIEFSETVYVGNDMLNDVYTAQQAGCKTVLFAGDQRSLRLRKNDERCKELKPDAIITSLSQLVDIV